MNLRELVPGAIPVDWALLSNQLVALPGARRSRLTAEQFAQLRQRLTLALAPVFLFIDVERWRQQTGRDRVPNYGHYGRLASELREALEHFPKRYQRLDKQLAQLATDCEQLAQHALFFQRTVYRRGQHPWVHLLIVLTIRVCDRLDVPLSAHRDSALTHVLRAVLAGADKARGERPKDRDDLLRTVRTSLNIYRPDRTDMARWEHFGL